MHSNRKIIFQIASTYLVSKKKQTITTVLTVTFGIAIFIFMISVVTGINTLLEQVMIDNTPHVYLYKEVKASQNSLIDKRFTSSMNMVHHVKPVYTSPNLRDGFEIMELLRKNPDVYGVAPAVGTQVFYEFGTSRFNGNIMGIDIKAEDKLYQLGKKIVAGDMQKINTVSNGIIMGSGLAKNLNIRLDDRVDITTSDGHSLTLTVVAIFKTGLAARDNFNSYASLRTVQKILGQGKGYITGIKVNLKNLQQAKQVAAAYEQQFRYKAEDWQTANMGVIAAGKMREMVVYIVVIAILLVAGFSIFGILNMTIQERMKEIAVLKATGFSSTDIRNIFLYQSIFVGVIGGLLGMGIGFLMAHAMSKVPFKQEDFLNVDHYPVVFYSSFYIFAFLFGLLACLISGYFPSRKAGKIDPIAIIRG